MSGQWATQQDLADQCIYCDEALSLEKWEDEFYDEKRYFVNHCGCGKKLWVRFDIDGFGEWKDWHDRWEFAIPPFKFNRFWTRLERRVKSEYGAIKGKK